jgi:hypothetical protein
LLSSNTLNGGAWHDAALVRKAAGGANSSMMVYVDGRLDSASSHPDVADLRNEVSPVPGQNVCDGVDGAVPYSGAADALQIWNRALSADEVSAIYEFDRAGELPAANARGLLHSWPARNAVLDRQPPTNAAPQSPPAGEKRKRPGAGEE